MDRSFSLRGTIENHVLLPCFFDAKNLKDNLVKYPRKVSIDFDFSCAYFFRFKLNAFFDS